MIKKQLRSYDIFKAFRDEQLILEGSFMDHLYVRGAGFVIPNRVCPDCGQSVVSKHFKIHMKIAHPEKKLSPNEISLFNRLESEL